MTTDPCRTGARSSRLRWLGAAMAVWLVAGCGARTDIDVPRSSRDGDVTPFDAGQHGDGSVSDGGDPRAEDARTDAARSCPQLRVSFGTLQPTVVLILDRSGSMDALFRHSTPSYPSATRWEVVRNVLVGEDERDGLLDVHAPRIRYGLVSYTSRGRECPLLRIVPPRLDNAGAISDDLFSSEPEGGTPTAEAIRAVTAMLPGFTSADEPVAYVLATDGEPNTCRGAAGARDDVVAATREAFDLGVRTFVLSVGRDVAEEHLQDVANAGAGRGPGDGDAEFWIGTAPGTLRRALDAALGSAHGCVGTLSAGVDPARACELEVSLDGEPVPCDSPDGFALEGERRIRFSGEACARVRTGEATLEVDAACDL